MIDTHCHLTFKLFKNQVPEVIARAQAVGVTDMVTIGTHLKNSAQSVQLAAEHDGVWAAVGVHPHHVYEFVKQGVSMDEAVRQVKAELSKLLTHPKVVAVGEIGFDKHGYEQTVYDSIEISPEYLAFQRSLFITQLELAQEFQKSVCIHNREAIPELLQVFADRPDLIQPKKMVLHCCEPAPELLDLALQHQLFIGVDGDLTYTPAKQAFIKQVPLEHIVVETDSPYLLPEPERTALAGKPFKERACEPMHVVRVVEEIAKLKDCSVDEVDHLTVANSKQLFLMVK